MIVPFLIRHFESWSLNFQIGLIVQEDFELGDNENPKGGHVVFVGDGEYTDMKQKVFVRCGLRIWRLIVRQTVYVLHHSTNCVGTVIVPKVDDSIWDIPDPQNE